MLYHPIINSSDDDRPSFDDAFLKTAIANQLDYDDSNCQPIVFTDNTTPQTWLIELSYDQVNELIACILQGAIIIYPNDVQRIYYNFVRSMDCTMDICQAVLDCINNTQEIQDAISYYSSTSNIQNTTPESATNLATNLLGTPAGCDNDIIYGMTVQLVEFMDRTIKDLFEAIDASQFAAVNAGYIIKLIPVLETLPIDELFELTDKLVDEVETAYLGASTQILKTQIACDLFCIAQANNCVLTLEDVRDYFEAESGLVVTYTNPLVFINDFISGTFIGNVAYYGMNLLFSQILVFGGKFLEFLFEDYLQIIQAMYNDPNPDHVTECDACPDLWSFDSDFNNSQSIFVPGVDSFTPSNMATWASGTGWSSVDIQQATMSFSRLTNIKTSEFTPTKITRILLTYDLVKGGAPATASALIIQAKRADESNVLQVVQYQDAVNGNGQTLELLLSNETNIKRIDLQIRCSQFSTATYAGTAKIQSVRVEGEGFNPFV